MKYSIFYAAILIAHFLTAQEVVLKPEWKAGMEWKFENVQIVPMRDLIQLDPDSYDTVINYGVLKVVSTEPATILSYRVTGVRKTRELTEDGQDIYDTWQALIAAGNINYSLTAEGRYDTIISIDSFENAVRIFSQLTGSEYSPVDTTIKDVMIESEEIADDEYVETEVIDEETEVDDESGYDLNLTDLTRASIIAAIEKRLEFLHAYANDTMEIGVERNVTDYPEFDDELSGMNALFNLDMTGTGILNEQDGNFLYHSQASIDIGNMIRSMAEIFSDLDTGKKKKKKKNKEDNELAELADLKMNFIIDYILPKNTLVPMVFMLKVNSKLPASGGKPAGEFTLTDTFRLLE